jgi:hypothetical protein
VSSGIEKTFEGRILDKYPEIRARISGSEEFAAWREDLPALEIDDEKLYIRGGDMLRDEDQIMFEWARRHGLLSDEEIARASRAEGGDIP